MTKTKYDTAMIVGARPNFVKVAPLLRYFEEHNKKVLFIHTGQHWDKNMSEDIFKDIGLREPDINLDIHNQSMNIQLGSIINGLDDYINLNTTKSLFVFGDVTSTLSGAIVAKNNLVDCFHVEAGLRSNNLNMPEERNRIMVDSICDKLFTPSPDAVDNLLNENISMEKISNVGNIMIDTLVDNYEKITSSKNKISSEFSINRDYFVLTLHRPANLIDEKLSIIFDGLLEFTNNHDIVIPAHPRLKAFIQENNFNTSRFKVIDPQPYIKFLSLVYNSTLCLTDSGGLQEETTYLNKKCLTLRDETERPITVELGTNKVIGVNKNIISEINTSLITKLSNNNKIDFWDGKTSQRIYEEIYV
ncbi:UDP-N-acetylglucosamine 2-epimerase (non-hydrolyzing) [Candidatus Actinomarina]|nr:UDP-N-acetylglucosamine 2-epimerase (non-hydrolyzing) [Candidatus Actinomarina sp.]